jgi:RNA polymerase sigma-70 factor (ECF subfamily)
MNLSDNEIIQQLKKGNRKAFENLFNKYYALLCYEAESYIRSEYLVEEIVCDVFTRIWINRKKLVIKTSLRNYLVRSVHNSCTDYYRHQKYLNEGKQKISEAQVQFTLADLGENPLSYMITQELEDKIGNAIESLPEQYKKTFELSRFGNLSYMQIAEEMGISVNSVKTNIKKALAKLREILKDSLLLLIIF